MPPCHPGVNVLKYHLKGVHAVEWNDIYDENRVLTGRRHRRGERWKKGEFGLVVCVWVYDGRGNILLTRRAKEKSFPGTWENSGGAAKAGEDSRTAITRELFEETGIRAKPEEFEFLRTTRDKYTFFDHYCLRRDTPIEDVKLLPGETDAVQWASFEMVHELIETGQICKVIAKQFLEEEANLKAKK